MEEFPDPTPEEIWQWAWPAFSVEMKGVEKKPGYVSEETHPDHAVVMALKRECAKIRAVAATVLKKCPPEYRGKRVLTVYHLAASQDELTLAAKRLISNVMGVEKCWKSDRRLAVELMTPVKAVQYQLNALKKQGWISTMYDKSAHKRYITVNPDKLQCPIPALLKISSGTADKQEPHSKKSVVAMLENRKNEIPFHSQRVGSETHTENGKPPNLNQEHKEETQLQPQRGGGGSDCTPVSPPAMGGLPTPSTPDGTERLTPHEHDCNQKLETAKPSTSLSNAPQLEPQVCDKSLLQDGKVKAIIGIDQQLQKAEQRARDVASMRVENIVTFTTIIHKNWYTFDPGWTDQGKKNALTFFMDYPRITSPQVVEAITDAWEDSKNNKHAYFCRQLKKDVNDTFRIHPTTHKIMLLGAMAEMGVDFEDIDSEAAAAFFENEWDTKFKTFKRPTQTADDQPD